MNLKQHLTSVRARIADPTHWTTETCARDSKGQSYTEADHNDLCQFCLMGAIYEEAGVLRLPGRDDEAPEQEEIRSRLMAVVEDSIRVLHPGYAIPGLNDQLGHEAVLRVLDHAIERNPPRADAS